MKKNVNIFRSPSFCKGMSRVADMFGTLDEYRYSSDPDAESLRSDWQLVGEDLAVQIDEHERKLELQTC